MKGFFMVIFILLLCPFSKDARRCWTLLRLHRQAKGDIGQLFSLIGHYVASTNDREFLDWFNTHINNDRAGT